MKSILSYRSISKLWKEYFTNYYLNVAGPKEYTFIRASDPLINTDFFRAYVHDLHIKKNITNLDFVQNEFFNPERHLNIKISTFYTVWNNSLVVEAMLLGKRFYLLIDDDENTSLINYHSYSPITCMTTLDSKLYAGTTDGEIVILDCMAEPSVIFNGDTRLKKSNMTYAPGKIAILKAFQDKLLMVIHPTYSDEYTPSRISLLSSDGTVTRSKNMHIDLVETCKDMILITQCTDIKFLDQKLKLKATSGICKIIIRSITVLDDTIAALTDFNCMKYGKYQDIMENPQSIKNLKSISFMSSEIKVLNKRFMGFGSKNNQFSDIKSPSQPFIGSGILKKLIKTEIFTIDTNNICIDKTKSWDSTHTVQSTICVKEDKVYIFGPDEIIRLRFDQ